MNNNRENIKMCGIDAYFGTSELNLSALAMGVAAVALKRYEKSTPNVAPNKEHER